MMPAVGSPTPQRHHGRGRAAGRTRLAANKGRATEPPALPVLLLTCRSAWIGECGPPSRRIEVLCVVARIAEHASVRCELHRNDYVPDVAPAVIVDGFDEP